MPRATACYFFAGVARDSKINSLDFDDDPGHDLAAEFLDPDKMIHYLLLRFL